MLNEYEYELESEEEEARCGSIECFGSAYEVKTECGECYRRHLDKSNYRALSGRESDSGNGQITQDNSAGH